MPVTSGSQSLLASLPTFMSVFGDGSAARNATSPPTSSSTTTTSPAPARPAQHANRRPSYQNSGPTNIYRRDSGVTIRTESTDSSPTTTISTVDSSLTEPSPSSSPESPNSLLPNASPRSSRVNTPVTEDETMYRPSLPSTPSPSRDGFSRSDSPNKKPRNTKNLSVNTSGANKPTLVSSLPRLATTEKISSLPNHAFSAPASPSFVIPVMAPKRKPSNLGLCITTPETVTKLPFHRSQSDVVPQTPSFAHLSNTSQFDESMPLFSPMGAPAGGMRLPPLGNVLNTNIPSSKSRPALSLNHHASFDSNRSSPIVLQTLDHVPEETDHDLPLSREVKSPAYPEGPVCIYEPSVYLFLEPNDEEAAKFDVVINVASEVKNPFLPANESTQPETKNVGVQVNFAALEDSRNMKENTPEPPSAVSEKSFRSAFESLPSESLTYGADTSKVIKNQPEYIHVPWEHNTKVSLELLALCELIDDRVKRGKRVLIHCQCGVSRSASLIIAYGLYKNPDLTDNEAYNAVKDRSKWINPNMHFIFELHAFKKMLNERFPKPSSNRRGPPGKGLSRTQTDSVLKHNTFATLPMSPLQDEPSTAPLEREQDLSSPRSNSLSPPSTAQLANISANDDITPGPSSAPADMISSPSVLDPLPQSDTTNRDTPMANPPPIDTITTTVPPRETTLTPMMLDLGVRNPPFPNTATTTRISPLPEPNPNLNLPVSVVENSAQETSTLPPPTLALGKESALRNQPSLPGGFISLPSLLSRRTKAKDKDKTISNQLPLRSENASLPSLQQKHIPIDTVMSDAVPETPSLLSPRAAEFTASPFHRTVAGDLAGSSVWEQGLMSPRLEVQMEGILGGVGGGDGEKRPEGISEEDPRSPPVRGEVGVWRSIDDVI